VKIMDKNVKIFVIALAVLVILTPIGLLASGTAYGEWGPEDLQGMVGYVPAGLQQLSDLWHPLLPDYDLPGGHDTMPAQTPGYILSAIIGVVLCAGVMYGVGKAVAKNN
jgi:cobalt/nickel transport protein